MRSGVRAFLCLGLVSLMVPTASAAFGPESADGYPINEDGEVLYPPVEPVVGTVALDPLNKVGPFTVYPYFPLLTAELQRLALEYPHLVRLTSAGQSTAGLDLWLLEIADFENPDKVPMDAREVVYLDGGTHSNEYSGVYFVTEIAQFLIEEYETNETARWIVENRHTWILPMVNPDGSNAFGRMNAKWVNVNRNFPGSWGTVNEDMVLNNPGPEPASELETQAVIKLMERIEPDYVNSIHCCGNLWLHPFGAEQLGDAMDVEMYTRICDEVFMDVRDDCGPIWSTIYPASGTTADEGYIRMGASSWTYEMSGRGRVAGPWGEPAVNRDVRDQERESWRGVVHAMVNVHLYGAHPVIESVAGTADRLEVTVANTGFGPLMAGNVSVADAKAALPMIPVNGTATVVLEGSFEAGAGKLLVDWQKRLHKAPWEERAMALKLVEDAGGGLVGIVSGVSGESGQVLDEEGSVEAPAPMLGLVVVAALAAAVLATRRRQT